MKQTENFEIFKLCEKVYTAVGKMGYTTPTPIQRKAIPVALKGQDILACAGTGTGKTAAFGIPIAHRLIESEDQSAMIIAPTRELATQICKELERITQCSQRKNLKPVLLIGGNPMDKQLRALKAHPRIWVGTPGRILDHLDRQRSQGRYFQTLVLDEADRMLDMGFHPQLKKIIKHLPPQRQTLLFSATLPKEILNLAKRYQKNPYSIDLSAEAPTLTKVSQMIVEVTRKSKDNQLLDQLIDRKGSIIIFVGTRRQSNRVASSLKEYGHKVSLIHGERSQAQRNRAMLNFRDGRSRILVATDVAARGIDVPQVAHVINYDLPQCPEDYIHRIGRTARAGAQGSALCLFTPSDRQMWQRIIKLGVGAPALSESSQRPHVRENIRKHTGSRKPSSKKDSWKRNNQTENRKRRGTNNRFKSKGPQRRPRSQTA